MLIGFGRTTHPEYMYNLIPFETIRAFLQIDRFNSDIWIFNLVGNIGVFVPFGLLIPLITKNRLYKSFIIFFSGVLVLETLQLLLRRGSFDIDDFILNSIGFFIGYGFYRIFITWGNLRSSSKLS
jgi:glycopeptide antibiotics resistance protein